MTISKSSVLPNQFPCLNPCHVSSPRFPPHSSHRQAKVHRDAPVFASSLLRTKHPVNQPKQQTAPYTMSSQHAPTHRFHRGKKGLGTYKYEVHGTQPHQLPLLPASPVTGQTYAPTRYTFQIDVPCIPSCQLPLDKCSTIGWGNTLERIFRASRSSMPLKTHR